MRGWKAVWCLGVAALFAVGCGTITESDRLDSKGQRQTLEEANLLSIALPSGVDVEQTGLVANGSLMLRDRASYVGTTGTKLPVVNVGVTATEVGANVTGGPITSHASVLLRSNTVIQGNVVSAGTVTSQAGVSVQGSTTQNAALPPPTVVTWEPPLSCTPSAARTVNPDGTMTLAPGSYGALTVFSRGRLRLRSGNYAFSNIQIEPQAVIEVTVTPSDGPLVLYADQISAFRGTIATTTSESTAESLLLVHRGTNTLRLESSANLAIVAPKATVELATGGAQYRGSLYAKGVHLEPDVRLTYVPFKYWAWILPPKPEVSCVFPSGRGAWTAAFGYANRPNATVDIPAGARNFLSPNPGPQFPPITRFLPGEVARALWVPMPEAGVSWTIHGRSAVATRASERCEFPEEAVAQAPRGEGRPLPRPSVPSVPAPRRQKLALENASGPGRFQASVGFPGTGPATTFQVSDPNVPAIPGVPPDVPDGYVENGTVPVTLRVDTDLAGENFGETDDLHAWSTIGGVSFPDQDLDEQERRASYSATAEVPRGSPIPVTFNEVEYNKFSDHEMVKLELSANLATGEIVGVQRGGKLDKHWVFPLPITIENFVQETALGVSTRLGEVVTFPFYGGNTVRWSVSAPPTPTGTTRVCTNWTGYYVDEATPSPDLAIEAFQGQTLDGDLRVRGYRASYAYYVLKVKGATASYSSVGYLDHDGCVAVPTSALVYRDDVRDGSLGGIQFYFEIDGQMVVPGVSGDATFNVVGAGSEHAVFQFTTFNEDQGGWALDGGYRVPPAEILVTRPSRDHGSTVAAIISHSLRRMVDEGVTLPGGRTYSVSVGSGGNYGTKDYAGNDIPDSEFDLTTNTLHIGPAFFPCAPGLAGVGCARQPCSGDTDCLGGQHCAKDGDAADGCEGGTCYCAYSDQGTSKYVVTHELGHMIQFAKAGFLSDGAGYGFKCQVDATGTCTENLGRLEWTEPVDDNGEPVHQLVDPPNMHEVCGCQHVTTANAWHCLQSIERAPGADREGFGQFFSSLMWNRPTDATCRFNYYKEVLDVDRGCRASDPAACPEGRLLRDGGMATVTFPPVPIDCRTPVKWRNRNSCNVSESTEPGLAKSTMGTEYDWMTFLFEVNLTFGFNDLMNIYTHACRPEYSGAAGGLDDQPCEYSAQTPPIAWVDGVIGDEETGIEHGGFLDGARRKWGALDSRARSVLESGNLHGVSADETSLP